MYSENTSSADVRSQRESQSDNTVDLAPYLGSWRMRDGTNVLIRPIRPQDEARMVKFHSSLSKQTVYLRYFYFMKLSKRISPERLKRICSNRSNHEVVLVAQPLGGSKPEIIAVGRLCKLANSKDAEIALLVSDAYQRRGLGTELLNRLLHIARARDTQRVFADVLVENRAVERIARKLDFPVEYKIEGGVIRAEISLSSKTGQRPLTRERFKE